MASINSPGPGESAGVPQPSASDIVKTVLGYLTDGRRFSSVKADIEKQIRLLETICIKQQQWIADLEDFAKAASICQTNHAIKKSPTVPSYASVAGQASKQPIKTKHVVRVYPSEAGSSASSEATKELLKQVDIKGLNIGVKSLKSISKQGVAVECRNAQEARQLTQVIADSPSGSHLKAEVPKRQLPMFTAWLRGVDYNIDDLSDDIYAKNEYLPQRSLNVLQQWKTPNGNTIVELDLSPAAYRLVAERDFKLFVGWNTIVKLRERDPISQCFKCQRFGHRVSGCKYQVDGHPATRCPQCAGNHASVPNGRCTAPPRCSNCVDYNIIATKRSWGQVDTGHSAKDRNCPSRIRIIERAKQQLVDYGC